MANLAAALKDEIRRLARKEIKAQTATTVRAVAQYRREIAKLKRQLVEQQRRTASLDPHQFRPRADSITSQGSQNGAHIAISLGQYKLRAANYVKLVGVQGLII